MTILVASRRSQRACSFKRTCWLGQQQDIVCGAFNKVIYSYRRLSGSRLEVKIQEKRMQRENKERKPIRRKVKGVRLLIPTVTIATIPFPFAFCGGQHPAGGPGPFCFWILSAVSFQRALLALFDCGKSYANC